jgi:1-aminocyclopropane-1-carboxylate deaminase/D-cysteine desulfhydrase-like pyridoxal-dependent ACC family enzyme
VSTGEPEKTHRALTAANTAAVLLGISTRISYEDLFTDNGFIGEGYGIPTPECLEAITLLARTEGILLDPCYTGKAMAGLIAHVRSGDLRPEDTVVFLHTGGAPGMFTREFAELFSGSRASR